MSELILNDKNFEKEVLKSKEPVLVDFWAPWCGPCQAMSPIVDALAKEYEKKTLLVGKLNIDENGQTPSKYGVMSIPTLILFKNGKPVEQFMGVQNKEKLKKKIDALLK